MTNATATKSVKGWMMTDGGAGLDQMTDRMEEANGSATIETFRGWVAEAMAADLPDFMTAACSEIAASFEADDLFARVAREYENRMAEYGESLAALEVA